MEKPTNYVAAIDFGTCNTRMAYAKKPKILNKRLGPEDITVMTDWESSPGIDRTAPTTILIDRKGGIFYGYEAEETMSNLTEDDLRKCFFVRNFKMELHERETFKDDIPIEATNCGYGGCPKTRSAIDVFSRALRYLADKLIAFMSKSEIGVIHPNEIQWVLTVPAIWKPVARHFMRKAAYQAKLCHPSTRKQLIIALEPECAALYVRAQKDQRGEKDRSLQYGVVDCGGGTIDIAYHSVEDRGEGAYVVNELDHPTGGPVGGVLVDRAFERLLEPVFRRGYQPFFVQLKTKYTAEWLELMKDLEGKKTQIAKKKDDDTVFFKISAGFNIACEEISGKDAYALLAGSKVDGITLSRNRRIEIRVDLVKGLYGGVIDAICMRLSQDLAKRRLSNITALYMVGAFSQSTFLLQSVRDKVRSNVHKQNIVNPPESHLAIVKGAVLYGLNPSIVQERVAALSYGLSVVVPFDSGKHPERKAAFYEGKKFCDDTYDEFVESGAKIRNSDKPIKRTYNPARSGQVKVDLKVYSAPHRVTFTDDPGCKYLGNLVVDMPITRGGTDRKVLIEIEFDGPEIHVVATDETTNKSYDASLDFLYDK